MPKLRARWLKAAFTDGKIIAVLLLLALGLAGRAWLVEHPQHNPWAPLDLNHPRGWATASKLAGLRDDPQLCHAVLTRSEVAFTALAPTGENACRREDRLLLPGTRLVPADAEMSCTVAAGLQIWLDKDVQPLAQQILGARVASIRQLGTYSCRRMYGRAEGRWSEHATGNAIDIAGFVLEDGREIALLRDWSSEGTEEGQFLRAVRDAACQSFGTVLSPDYNQTHADHFHLDQGFAPGRGPCR